MSKLEEIGPSPAGAERENKDGEMTKRGNSYRHYAWISDYPVVS